MRIAYGTIMYIFLIEFVVAVILPIRIILEPLVKLREG